MTEKAMSLALIRGGGWWTRVVRDLEGHCEENRESTE